jgi:transcriptional regulator with XRE-family HTH domain
MDSKRRPLDDAPVAHAAAEAVRKAHAVGLFDRGPDFPELTYPEVRRAASCVREAGIAAYAAAIVERPDPPGAEELARALREIDARLEESPLPDTEWPRVGAILEAEQLAALLDISASSLARYARGERTTPDGVAARLHLIALIVGDLAGAYNAIGIRRWFERPRTALDGGTPAALLSGAWTPEDPGPQRVRALARALVSSPAT